MITGAFLCFLCFPSKSWAYFFKVTMVTEPTWTWWKVFIITNNFFTEELALIKKLLEFPDIISKAAKFLEPHRIPNYLQDLAATFHRFYHHHRVVTEDKALTEARLILIKCTKIVLANAFKLLGISAPERM